MQTISDVLRFAADLDSDGRWEQAEDIVRRLLDAMPGEALVSHVYSQHLLARGEYLRAWPLFLRRLDTPFYRAKGTTNLPAPFWDGASASNSKVLVHVDEGLGDLIMCARYMPMVADRVGKAVLAVPAGSGPLFATIDPRIDIVELGQPAPSFDLHLHAFSLPAVFATTLDTIPAPECLRAAPEPTAREGRLLGDGFKVGLVWQGNSQHPRDSARSIPLSQLIPLLRVPGVRFISLQLGGRDQLGALPPDIRVVDAAKPLIETAAIISGLDIVISIDSALAHLAGALGRPAWIALMYSPDWRWLRSGATSPWYPRARLFRQTRPDDWSDCIAALSEALRQRCVSSNPSET